MNGAEVNIVQYLLAIISWGIVPVILIGIIIYAFNFPKRVNNAKVRISSRAGTWSGLVILILYILTQSSSDRTFTMTFELPALELRLLVILPLVLVGFGITLIFNLIDETRGIGLLLLITVASSSIALFEYFFAAPLRSEVVFGTLSVFLGILLCFVFFPRINFPRGEKGHKTKIEDKD